MISHSYESKDKLIESKMSEYCETMSENERNNITKEWKLEFNKDYYQVWLKVVNHNNTLSIEKLPKDEQMRD